MKHIFLGLILISLLLSSGCNATPVTPKADGGVVFAKSDLARNLEPVADPRQLEVLAQGNTVFALNFYNQISQMDGNLIFSPISLSLALSMTLAGAELSTRDEMLQALALQPLGDDLHPAFNALLLAIEASQSTPEMGSEGDSFRLNIANSIWGQSGFDFEPAFLDTLALNYGAGIYNLDFSADPEAAREAINAWVADETEEKIKDLIPSGAIDALTRLVLANAIYFNGSWLYPFDQSATQAAPFNLLGGTQVPVDMMHLQNKNLPYLRGANYQVARLPYLSPDFSMILLVPDEDAFELVESSLIAAEFVDIVNKLSMRPVDLQMPKFDFESTVDASRVLKELGMLEAFQADQADFSLINANADLYITDVLHKATITVDEKGTEAAAATAVIVGVTSAPEPTEPVSLVIDRPFMFFIEHNPTRSILFMGRVLQP